ncbi:MAG: aldehyde ferredoxin oxidoreductase family protein [Candidatus Hodarchaeales archaeon]|jgi:aldehyde:ferredoxin oxidoreductase
MVWNQKIAYIDLSSGKIISKKIPKSIRESYLGGRGIDMYLMFNHIKPEIDPLSNENALIIGAGLLTGIKTCGASRCDVAAKSPLTGGLGNSNIGGHFGPELRKTGYDHLVITGKADKPVYLWIHDEKIEILDAKHLWGLDTFESQTKIQIDHDDKKIQSLVIGTAGEKLVRFANIRTGMKSAAGRTGMGCVMGSKNLKAISARGRVKMNYSYPKQLQRYSKELNKQVMETRWAQAQSKWGTMIIYNNTNPIGLIRTKNFQLNQLENGEGLEPENMEKYMSKMVGCYGCVIRCRHRYSLKEGKYASIEAEGPEYTSLGAFGTMIGCNRLETVLAANYLVNKFGIDTIETGGLIAWALELYEKGLINNKITDGLNLNWITKDNEEVLFELIRNIADRKGFGNILADGFKPAIDKIGKESDYYAIQIKGLSSLHSDERPTPSFALGIATSTRGADHLRSRPAIDLYGLPSKLLEEIYGAPVSTDYTSYDTKARMVWWQELLYAITDSIGFCKFQTIFCAVNAPKWEEFSKIIRFATGLEYSKAQLMEIGERIYTLERMFNIREGFSRKDDDLPQRFFEEPTKLGLPLIKGKKIDRKKFEEMIDEYYAIHGWNIDGMPFQKTLEQLHLDKEPSGII